MDADKLYSDLERVREGLTSTQEDNLRVLLCPYTIDELRKSYGPYNSPLTESRTQGESMKLFGYPVIGVHWTGNPQKVQWVVKQ